MREACLILFSPPFVRCLTLLLGSFIKVSISYYISFTSPAFCFSHFFLCMFTVKFRNPGAYTFKRPFLRGLSTEGNLRFKIDWASVIVGRKFTVFVLFYFVCDLTEGFFALPGWRAYIWKGLFSEFYGMCMRRFPSTFTLYGHYAVSP